MKLKNLKQNILITSAGRRVSLVKAFKESVKLFNIGSKVFITDLNPKTAPASYHADQAFEIGYFEDPNYMKDLLRICLDNRVSIVIPTIDTELKLLANSKDIFKEYGIIIVVSDIKLITLLSDKFKTNEFFNELNIKTPEIFNNNSLDFPVFLKPINGSNSEGVYKAENIDEIRPCDLNSEKMIILKYLDRSIYDEYTVDLYYDKNSVLKCIVPRKRIKVVGGESNQGITIKNDLLKYINKRFELLPGAIGCLTLQLFSNKSEILDVYGIEINPRFGGGYPFSYNAGANFPEFILREYVFNEQLTYFENWKDNCLNLRYDIEVVIDE